MARRIRSLRIVPPCAIPGLRMEIQTTLPNRPLSELQPEEFRHLLPPPQRPYTSDPLFCRGASSTLLPTTLRSFQRKAAGRHSYQSHWNRGPSFEPFLEGVKCLTTASVQP